MFRPLPFFIGVRYTRDRRRSLFVSFISLTSIIGLALGVLVMIVVLSVMNGFDREMRDRVLGMVPHATLDSTTPIKDWRTIGEGLLRHPQRCPRANRKKGGGLKLQGVHSWRQGYEQSSLPSCCDL